MIGRAFCRGVTVARIRSRWSPAAVAPQKRARCSCGGGHARRRRDAGRRAHGTPRQHHLALGRDFGSALEIRSGVPVDDALVVDPGDDVPRGATVRVARPITPADSP